MTILHIIEPFASGITSFINYLTRDLPQHQHTVLHGRRSSVDTVTRVQSQFPSTVRFYDWLHAGREINPVRDLRAFWFLLRFLRRHRFDIIHLHSSKAGILGRWACFFLGIRKVVYSPNAAPFLRTDVGAVSRGLYIGLEWIAARLTGVVVACCPSEQAAFGNVGIRARCISNGTPIRSVARVPTRVPLVMTAGLIKRQKNPAMFNAIASAFNHQADVPFCWVGDGELREALSSENIDVTGWKTQDEVEEYFTRASVYVSTSAWEGLPFAVLEAMNAGLCLLLSKCTGHVDLVTPGVNGYIFETKEEAVKLLSTLLRDPERLDRMGKASRELCERQFDARMTAKHFDDLYMEFSR